MLDIGQEHTVWFDHSHSVFKLTKNGHQGLCLVRGKYGDAELRQATPSEYFDRLHLQNKELGDSISVVGFRIAEQSIQIATTQPFVVGSEPTDREIAEHLTEAGFRENRFGHWQNERVILADTHTGNFIKSDSGILVPIDLIVVSKKSLGL